MREPIVSFCIATYQRYELLRELIDEILSVKSDEIEVVVCDDKSLDDSVQKLRKIKDPRFKICVNKENVGSLLNIHDSLEKGEGKYLFYVNDRDNVDPFKIEMLIQILKCLEKEKVAFAKCDAFPGKTEKYHIFQAGREALMEFSCKIDHPTGYIFKRECWNKIHTKRKLFFDQKYGDYVFTQICAILAQSYKGAKIYGDICNVYRRRIDFSNVKSGFYNNRTDKRLWYTPEVIFRELKIGQKFLKKIGIEDSVRYKILLNRYEQYLSLCVSGYKKIIQDPAYTAHYNYYPSQTMAYVFLKSILNGLKLWINIITYCLANRMYLGIEINKITRVEYETFVKEILENKNYKAEITRREAVLNTYEKWMKAELEGKKISSYLLSNGYESVAIYGIGRLGKHLLKELSDSGIHIKYVIDQNISKSQIKYHNIPCYNLDDDLAYVDLIIVTISGESGRIIKDIEEKGEFCTKSLDDVLFVI